MPYSMKSAKNKAKVKIKFQKMKGTFFDNIAWLKSHQPTLTSRLFAFERLLFHKYIFQNISKKNYL